MARFFRPSATCAVVCLLVAGPEMVMASPPPAFASWSVTTPNVPAPPGRPLTLDDVLSMETFGATVLSPDGRWAAIERRRPYDTAPRFDRAHRSGWTVSDLMIAATAGSAAPELLVPREAETGVLFGSWSPDSRRLLVYRLKGERLEAGVVTVADRSILWTGLTPDLPITGAASAWLDDHRLAMTTHPDGDLPWMLRFDGTGQIEMDRRWRDTREGRAPSRSRIETRAGRLTTEGALPLLQLVVLDVVSGDRRILEQGLIRDLAVSPQGDRLAVLTSAERVPTDPSGTIVQSHVQTRSRLTLIEITSGRSTAPSVRLDVAPNLLRWSPTGDALLVWAREDAQPWRDARLRAVGADGDVRTFNTGDLLPLAEGDNVDELQTVRAEWSKEKALFRGRRPGQSRFDWWRVGVGAPQILTAALTDPPTRLAAASTDRVLGFADGRLWALGSSGVAEAVTPAGPILSDGQSHTLMEAARLRVNEPPRRDWVVARSGDDLQFLDNAGQILLRPVAQPCAGTVQGRSVAALTALSVCLDQGVETLRLATPETHRVLDQVNAKFSGIAMPRARAIVHKDRLGRDATSYLFMPEGVEASGVKGLLVDVYPGGADDGRYVDATTLAMGPRAQILASEGYAVLSAAFTTEDESLRPEMIDDFVRGTNLAVDAALKAVPGLPEDRMAMIGHSFGGYVALAVATRSDRYRTYISWAGPSDEASNWGEPIPHARLWPAEAPMLDARIGATEVGQANMGGPPWDDIQAYAAASPFMSANKIQAPLLLITADRDYVPMSQAERMLTAMHRQRKWARLVTYWGETHTNASPANIRDVYREISDWLDRTLSPETARSETGDAPMPEPTLRSPPSP